MSSPLRLRSDEYRQWQPPELERRSHPRRQNEDPDAVREAARRAGYAEGLAAAKQDTDAQLQLQAQRFDSLLGLFLQPLSRLDDGVEQSLADLAMVLAKGLLRSELRVRPDKVVGVAKDAIDALPKTDRALRLVLHPNDAALVRELLEQSVEDRSISVIEDSEMTVGGCRVEGEFASVDATVEARVKALTERLYAELERQ